MRDWIGTGQSNSTPVLFEVRIIGQEKKGVGGWGGGQEACFCTRVFTETTFQGRLNIPTLFGAIGAIKSYYRQVLT